MQCMASGISTKGVVLTVTNFKLFLVCIQNRIFTRLTLTRGHKRRVCVWPKDQKLMALCGRCPLVEVTNAAYGPL